MSTKAKATVFGKGYKAGLEGKPKRSCPYEDKRGGNHDQVITWSRTWIRIWSEGWLEGNQVFNSQQRKEADVTE